MATFPDIEPSFSVKKDQAPLTRVVQYADGFEQRLMFGLPTNQNPRKYNLKVNSKIKKLARMSVHSSKLKDKKLIVLDKIDIETPKTKNFKSIIEALKLESKKITLY